MAEPQENPLNDLVQHALAQDFNKANKIFGDLMGVKIQDALDQEKIKLADQIYNGAEMDEDPEDEDENLEDENAEAGDEDTAEEEAEEDPVESEEDLEETEEEK